MDCAELAHFRIESHINMRKTLFILFLTLGHLAFSQLNLDTLAIQDFEVVPLTPTWTFTGPVIYNSGFSSASAAPPNSPLGIGGSRAWETTVNSGGLVLEFANVTIPPGYDSVRIHYNLAAMNLNGSTGGPDNLDYVLTAYSTDGGTTYINRLRIRGATADNSFWPYSATGVAKVFYTPATEALFQPTTTGLQNALGYSNCEIVFPGSVSQVRLKITARSSSSSDTWMIDNVVITGENVCSPSAATISASACDSYTSPSGAYTWTSTGTYMDTISNTLGCDSVITVNLSITNSSAFSFSATACETYTSPSGNFTWTASGTYQDTLASANGCDSVITVNLTVLSTTSSSFTATGCNAYVSPSGNQTWTSSGTYTDTLTNAAGCDSIITANITILNSTSSSISPTACDTYTAPSGLMYTSSGTYVDIIPNAAGCDSTITIQLTINSANTGVTQTGNTLTANASSATYQWIDCNNGNAPISGAISQSFTPAASGNYAVIITENGCTDTSSCVAVTVVGISGALTERVHVYPNPSHGRVHVELADPSAYLRLTVRDALGRVVLEQDIDPSGKWAVDLPAVSGLYLLDFVRAQGGSYSHKVLLE
jgi:hypothetical protein